MTVHCFCFYPISLIPYWLKRMNTLPTLFGNDLASLPSSFFMYRLFNRKLFIIY